MAEGLLNTLYGDRYEAYSAGLEPSEVNPYAIKVMAEINIDISKQRSKSIEKFRRDSFDYVVTVCNHAKEVCPIFPRGKAFLHRGFKDTSEFKGTEDEILAKIRRIRDEIEDWIHETFGAGNEGGGVR